MSDEARKLLNRVKNLDSEEFCTLAFVITSERGLIDSKIPLSIRYNSAIEILQAHIRKPQTVVGGSLPDVDYYDILGIDESATQEEIENAYKQRKASLQPDVLEKKLQAQGLSEKEIRERLTKANNTLYYVEGANSILGNEKRRDHYDEHLRSKRQSEWGKTLDRKQKKTIRKKSTPVNHGENWNILNLTPNPTQMKLRTAYLALARNSDPERYLKRLNKSVSELTTEELREYNITQERWSNINRAYAEELDIKKLREERRKLNSSTKERFFSKEQFNILISVNPTAPKTQTADKVLWKVKNFYNTVFKAGGVEYTPEEVLQLKSEGLIPDTATVEEVNRRMELALDLHARGVKAADFSQAIDKTDFLTEDENKSFQLAAFFMESMETENPERANSLHIGNQEPTVSINKEAATNTTPQPNQLILQGDGEGFLKPILKQSFEIVKDKVEGVVKRTLEKTGLSTAKTAVKKFASEALKKAGKQLLKLGSKIAAKAGLQAVATLAPGVGNAIAFFVTDVLPRLLEPVLKHVKKALSNVLRFITGKDDLKSQLKELSGVALVGSLATGAVVPAAISGVVFFSAIGTASIIATLNPIFTGVFIVVTSTVLAVSIPLIVGVLVFVLLVIFITFIINNSAFVVPYGGINAPDPGSPPLPQASPYIKVEKIAVSPDGEEGSYLELSNPNPSTTITYTINITALEGDLVNISVNEYCYAQGEDLNLTCPERSQWLPIPNAGLPNVGIISSGETFTIEYTRTFNAPDYWNSLITDRVTVSAGVQGQTAQTATATAQVCFGDCPKGCPYLWPVETGFLTQGPNGCWSHEDQEAVDIAASPGLPVYATHEGAAYYVDSSTGGNMIRIYSTCAGVSFSSLYAHLDTRKIPDLPNGYEVISGEQIGTVGRSGTDQTGYHLHYEFNGLQMIESYIPEPILPVRDCCTDCASRCVAEDCTTTVVNFR